MKRLHRCGNEKNYMMIDEMIMQEDKEHTTTKEEASTHEEGNLIVSTQVETLLMSD
jgi:hypothetical protein